LDLAELTDGGQVTLSPETIALANSLNSIISSSDFLDNGESLTPSQADEIDLVIARMFLELNTITVQHETVFGNQTPQYTNVSLTAPELIAVRFKVTVPGNLLGIRYYRILDSIEINAGVLFADDGSQDVLAQADFTNQNGWITAPVEYELEADTPYVAAVYAPGATYIYRDNFFGSAVTVGNITFPAHSTGSPNGCYQTNPAVEFPTLGIAGGRNFYVDIEFEASE
jgi:hypothetical protein